MNNPHTEKVLRGAALLDREHPGWRDKIDLALLDLSDRCSCILGQIFAFYEEGISALWGIDTCQFRSDEWIASPAYQTVVAHGFSIDLPYQYHKWRALQEAWTAEL